MNWERLVLGMGSWLVLAGLLQAAPPSTRLTEGIRDKTPTLLALTGARVVVAPGRVLEQATIVVRDGVIVAVGGAVTAPADARIWDMTGKTIYPGFLDAYSGETVDVAAARPGAAHSNTLVVPQLDMAREIRVDPERNQKLRAQGIVARLAVPTGAVFRGQSCLLDTSDEPLAESLLRGQVAQHMQLTISRSPRRDSYPNSPMGVMALVRQTLLDAQWYRAVWSAAQGDSQLPRPERNDALETLELARRNGQLFILDAHNDLYFIRADRVAREFGLRAAIFGSGREYRRLDDVVRSGRTVILPLNFVKPPNVSTIESARHVSLEDLQHWYLVPENAGRLDKAGVRIAFATQGLKDPGDFLPAVRRTVERGLAPDSALRALTVTPAELLGVADQCGTIEPGKLANFVVTAGDLFDAKTKIHSTWIRGNAYRTELEPLFDPRGVWEVVGRVEDGSFQTVWLSIQGDDPREIRGELLDGKPDNSSQEGTADATRKRSKLIHLVRNDFRLTLTFDLAPLGGTGRGRLAMNAKPESTATEWTAEWIWPDDRRVSVICKKLDSGTQLTAAAVAEKPDKPNKLPSLDLPIKKPFGAFGRDRMPPQELVVFRNATIWTSGPLGNLANASLLIGHGKILAIGDDVPTPEGAVVVDCQGKFISAGIIDCHSHMATDGGVNETGRAVTAQVRIGDFIDDTDISIYRQLAGGVTTAHVLHGSANPIGGQCQVIKLRWGAGPEELKMAEAPSSIKFALGENVKQSNWTERSSARYPQTRMGVEQIMRDEFQAAREYLQSWDSWERDHRGLPPRRDLELEAIGEILQGKRWIHCHSYRQDEIVAFLRVAEEFSVQVGCMQHILEGYKVADVMRKHGVMASSFSDWWAYKFEVFDSIPQNGAILHQAGVVVSFNSDDRELARHLNQEAAKAVRYGGVDPLEAFQFVTLNPAKQLRIDQFVGSLEVGKHADLVVWNAPPLSIYARPEQTWVDGRRMFDRTEDLQLRQEARQLRATLVQRILDSGESMRELGQDFATEQDDLWPRDDEFCHEHPHQ